MKEEVDGLFMFAYSPFIAETSELPLLELKTDEVSRSSILLHLKATFSSSPKSPDCVFFVVLSGREANYECRIFMCRREDLLGKQSKSI